MDAYRVVSHPIRSVLFVDRKIPVIKIRQIKNMIQRTEWVRGHATAHDVEGVARATKWTNP